MSEDAVDRFRNKLAKWLSVSYDELEEYGEDVEANDGSNGKLRYGYFIQFSNATPIEILRKVNRIDKNRTVYFNLEELDE